MDAELIVDQATLRYQVARTITCPIGGRVLDVKHAVMAEVTMTNGKVLTAIAHEDEEAEFNARLDKVRPLPNVKSIKVYDGRVLFGKGKAS